jgi:GDPmannose 4,6-dehydratase
VREFVEKSFAVIGTTIKWKGSGLGEVGYCQETGKEIVKIDSKYHRPAEVDLLLGDSSKARKLLKWNPKSTFDELVIEMVLADIEKAKRNIPV